MINNDDEFYEDVAEDLDNFDVEDVNEEVFAEVMERFAPEHIVFEQQEREWNPKGADEDMITLMKPLMVAYDISDRALRTELKVHFRA